ncbi:MAG: type II toxin-antitoxin system death-on-curing family toxin [bacterium]
MKAITVAEVEYLAYELAEKQMAWNEPIPDFGTRYVGKLESCLSAGFQTYAKKELYPGLLDKVSIIFYLMIKNHPFMNGNKRIAIATILTFLYINEKWLDVSNDELYHFAIWVAASNPRLKDGVVLAIHSFIKSGMIDL